MFNGGYIKRDYSSPNFLNYNTLAPRIPIYSSNHHNPLPPIYKELNSPNYKDELNSLGKRISDSNQFTINNHLPKVPLSGYSLEDTNQYLQKGNQIQQQQYEKYIANANEKKKIMNDMHSKIKLLGKSPLEEEYKKLQEEEEAKDWKSNLKKEVNEVQYEIKNQLEEEMKRDKTISQKKEKERKEHSIDDINQSIINLQRELSSQLLEFEKNAKYTFEDIKSSLAQSNEKQLEYLVNKIFPLNDNNKDSDSQMPLQVKVPRSNLQIDNTINYNYQSEYEQNKYRKIQVDNNLNMLIQPQQRLESIDPNNAEESINQLKIINSKISPQLNHEVIQPLIDYNEMVDNLDLRVRYLRKQKRTHKEVCKRLTRYSHFCQKMPSISRFRAYVYFMIAAKRLLNIQYIIYSRFKFNSVHYFINNYEDMDIIIQKNMYRSIRPVLHELIKDEYLDVNISYEKANSHALFVILKELLELMVNGLTKDFSKGVSGSMLTYLSLFITNYSYIPSAFFTTFELVRFRTTPTGEFIALERDQQIMILGFYLFFKILLKSILLELTFNQETIPDLSRKSKLNIKMIVSILYRGLIKEFKKCPRQRNVFDIDLKNGFRNYTEIGYIKKEFDVDFKMRRRKKKNTPISIQEMGKKYYMDRYLYRAYKGLNDEGIDNLEGLPALRKMINQKKTKKTKIKRSLSLPEIDSQQSLVKQQSRMMKNNEEEFVNWMKEDEKVTDNNHRKKSLFDNKKEEENAEQKNQLSKKNTKRKKGKSNNEEIDNVKEDENLESKKSLKTNSRLRIKKGGNNKVDLDEEEKEDNEDDQEIEIQPNGEAVKCKQKKKGKKLLDENENTKVEINTQEKEENNMEGNLSQSVNAKKARKQRTISNNKAPRMPPPNLNVNSPEHPNKTVAKKKTKGKQHQNNDIDQVDENQEEIIKKRKSQPKLKPRAQQQELNQIEEEDITLNQKRKKKSKRKKIEEELQEGNGKFENDLQEIIKLKPKNTINAQQIGDEYIDSNIKDNKRRQLKESKSQININPNAKLKHNEINNEAYETQLIDPTPMILTNENNWAYKCPIFLPEFNQDEIKTMKYIFKELPRYGDDSDQNEFELIDRIVYQNDKLYIYELYSEEYAFDPISPLMVFLEDLLDLIHKHFIQEDD